MNDEIGFWAFHLPNTLLAALIYTLIGRYILSLFFPHDSDKTIWRVFRQITDPIISATRAVTPAIVPLPLVNLFAIVWLFVLRVLLFYVIRSMGIMPGAGV